MRYCLSLILFVLIAITALAQPGVYEFDNESGKVRYNDYTKIGNKKKLDVSYRDVKGDYLWSNDWNPALVVMKGGNAIKMSAARINLYTNEIHYLDKSEELSASIDKVKQVVLFSNDKSDSTKVVGVFDVLANIEKKTQVFYEVMNDGKLQFLRRTTIGVKKDGYDASMGRDEYRFDRHVDYFIRGESMKQLTGLSKSKVLEIVPHTEADEKWLDANKNKLKKPEEIAEFLKHLNSAA